MTSPIPVIIVRLPFDRPQDGGFNDPVPIEWTPDKERQLWHELSSSRTQDNADVDWQALATTLNIPLPYLLYKTQARYEQDLRKINEIKPVVSTVALPRALSDENRARAPHLDRRPSSFTDRSPSAILPNSPRKSEKPSLPNLSSSRLHTPSVPSRPLLPRTSSDRVSESADDTSSSSSEADEAEEALRTKEEQENVGRKLKELERLMSSDTLGFARPTTSRALPPSLNIKAVETVRSLQQRTLRAVLPNVREKYVEETTVTSAVTDDRRTGPRTSRFSRDVIPSIPSSNSHSPSDSPNRQSSVEPNTTPTRSDRALGKGHQSESSQGSQASSFSDISDASVSASALEDAILSRAGGASRLSSMFARSHFASRGIP